MTPTQPELTEREQRFQQYFALLAPEYDALTGNTTRNIFLQALEILHLPISSDSVIHDNAAGPGTATVSLIDWWKQTGHSEDAVPTIVVTDYTKTMIDVFEKLLQEKQASGSWKTVKAQVMNSHSLAFPDNTFDFVFCNISIANFEHPQTALQEIYRTLKPNGKAVITNWKTFGFATVIGQARKKLKGPEGLGPPPIAGAEFMKEGYIATVLQDVGWPSGKIETHKLTEIVKEGPDMDGAMKFFTGPYLGPVKVIFSPDEDKQWLETVRQVVEEEKVKHGGIFGEAWVVVAQK
ncbi:S-adenosyl-L-methionine-dependent methyltransferase [Xylogone sp. PMI_703]|nr:S-adenosyl-L-methionine-dependent methyltransferase [Xylogone sp. PMI_703]